jgi:putative intracellular protease/amidase
LKILLPVPDRDFDTTEVAVPWQVLTERGHQIVFATEHGGQAPACDPLLLTGVVFGQLGAEPPAIADYRKLTEAPEFIKPIAWADIEPTDYDGLLLPGGHAPGMRQYLGSAQLRQKVSEFWQLGRPVGAICHGVLVLARTTDPATGHSVLHDRRTTCLPKYLERGGYFATAWRRGRYYRTYPAYVEDEVRAALADPTQFERGTRTLTRGTDTDDTHAFTVLDGNYVSARCPGDAYLFARRFDELLG